MKSIDTIIIKKKKIKVKGFSGGYLFSAGRKHEEEKQSDKQYALIWVCLRDVMSMRVLCN
jgi:hypothetical protein